MPEELRAAIAAHTTATTDDPWDAGAMMSRMPAGMSPAAMRGMFAWQDSGGDPAAKSTYKFPHHMMTSSGQVGAANLHAASAGIAALNGARGGTNISAADRQAVYNHLAHHLRDAGRTPPPLERSAWDDVVIREATELMGAGVNGHLLERRYTPGMVEHRQVSGLDRIGGYAAVFEKVSRNLGGFVEVVTPSFFNKSRLDGWPGVLARYNHDDNMLLGTTDAGTLRLNVDDTGLLYDVNPPSARQDIIELIKRGDVRRSSFAFRVVADEWTTTEQGYPLRQLIEGQLVDVAPVNSPAYTETTAGLRSLASRVGADIEEVRNAAVNDDLRKFLVKTGGAPPRPARVKGTFGPLAAALIREKEESAE
jgi:hypothetical protein